MFEDVLDATLAIDGWTTWVVSADENVREIGLRRGAEVRAEERPSLAGAVQQIEEEAAARDVEALAVLHADMPLVTTSSLRRALHTLGPVVIAPAMLAVEAHLLLRRPPDAIVSRFGRDSYRRHLEAAAERDLPIAVVDHEELAFDVDRPEDILIVLEARRPGRTLEVCRDLDLAGRLSART